MRVPLLAMLWLGVVTAGAQDGHRLRDHGLQLGILPPGTLNAITDVPGVQVGHHTLIRGDSVRTGVTAIVPHSGNIFQEKVPAAVYVENGFGKLSGSTQVAELGNIETPIVLTNTLSVPVAMNALIDHTLALPGNEDVRSVNALVGETNDGRINDIRGRHITRAHVLQALSTATGGPVAEGCVGAGTGTISFGYKGGIGSASRRLPDALGGYTVGVLVQTNFGGVLQIAGAPIGKALGQYPYRKSLEDADGSCMIILATDAPLLSRNLERLAKRTLLGLARTGGFASNGSGDYAIAFSTSPENRIPYQMQDDRQVQAVLHNDAMSPLFLAAVEATEEAILNALFVAAGQWKGHEVSALPVDKVLRLLEGHGLLQR